MNRSQFIAGLAFFLSGCIVRIEQPAVQFKKAESDTDCSGSIMQHSVSSIPSIPPISSEFSTIDEHQDQIQKSVSRMRHYDWHSTMQQMVGKMLQVQDVTVGSILLLDNVNNRTNGVLNAEEATETLRNALINNGKFTLVSTKRLSIAKRQLGLSSQDSLPSPNKAICIARNVQAEYVLYSNITGNVNSPFLQMQLMLVLTGEIIWSGKDTVILLYSVTH